MFFSMKELVRAAVQSSPGSLVFEYFSSVFLMDSFHSFLGSLN